GSAPGIAAAPDADHLALLRSLLAAGLPAVLDAGALRLLPLSAAEGFAARAPLVLTPHPGEFEALSGQPAAEVLADPAPALLEVARRFGAVVVLKAAVTWIAAPDGRLSVRDGLDPSLACAGSGDVLAGTIAGILAGEAARASRRPAHTGDRVPPRAPDPAPTAAAGLETAFRAAGAAVLAHSLAGQRARGRRGWYEAGALVDEIARVLEEAAR
ncbi:MAG: hypothetical protein JNG85_14760, partial [Spirochaetaceae bacterium]|nr:hypothetical protein [Spirochaetaceae bacterium]